MDNQRLKDLAGIVEKKVLIEGVTPGVVKDIIHNAIWDVLRNLKVKAPDHVVDDAIASAVQHYQDEMEHNISARAEEENMRRARW